MSEMGEKIKSIRNARKLTQQDVADKMGVKRNTVSQWESNTRKMSAEQLLAYAKIVGVTLDYFQDYDPQKNMFQVLAELNELFTSQNVPESDKDKAYRDIMQIYLASKETLEDTMAQKKANEGK